MNGVKGHIASWRTIMYLPYGVSDDGQLIYIESIGVTAQGYRQTGRSEL